MSYEPTNWKTGDVVTSAKLNKLENGVANAGGGGVLIVNSVNEETGDRLDKTFAEIRNAFLAGVAVVIRYDISFDSAEYGYTAFEYYIVYSIKEKENTGSESEQINLYEILTQNGSYSCTNMADYPTINE